jgi:hypothetical protein
VPLELLLLFDLPVNLLVDQKRMARLAHQIPKRSARTAVERTLLACANLAQKRDAPTMRYSSAQMSLLYALTLPVEEM